MLPSSTQELEAVALLNLHDPSHASIPLLQTQHRFNIQNKWNIPTGARVLEIGCGQGECTVVLAHTVGPSGHVTAVDPGPIHSYGSPYTLAEAQEHISKGTLGSRITWVEADPIDFLNSKPDAKYDYAVLAHCIWYFSRSTTLDGILRALRSHARHIAVAEWALTASTRAGMPHVLAALAQGGLHPHLRSDYANVRTIMSPSAIRASASQSKLKLLREEFIVPPTGLQDGNWEVSEVKSAAFTEEINKNVDSESQRNVLYALRDAVLESANALKARGVKVECMDVWTAVFASDV